MCVCVCVCVCERERERERERVREHGSLCIFITMACIVSHKAGATGFCQAEKLSPDDLIMFMFLFCPKQESLNSRSPLDLPTLS